MSGYQKVIVAGMLGQDPEIRYTSSGSAVANISVATSEKYKDKESTEWHRIVAFGKTAELVAEYLKKGSFAIFDGKLQTKKWQDKNGQDRYTTEIICQSVTFGPRSGQGGNRTAAEKQADTSGAGSNQGQADVGGMEFDDIPFAPISSKLP